MNVLGLGTYDSDEEIDLKEEPHISANEHLSTALPTKFCGPSSSSIVVESNETEGEETKSIDKQTAYEFNSSKKVPSASSVIQNTYNHLHELPPSPRDQPNPKTVRKIGEYLELKEISGFNLTEVRYITQGPIFYRAAFVIIILTMINFNRILEATRILEIHTFSGKQSNISKLTRLDQTIRKTYLILMGIKR